MKRILSLYLIATCSLFLVACHHRSHGSEFLGKWVNIQTPSDSVLISQDGDKFIIADPHHQLVATYCDGMLSPNDDKGQCSYLRTSDTMNCAGVVYKRAK
jgi:hypothetical protein